MNGLGLTTEKEEGLHMCSPSSCICIPSVFRVADRQQRVLCLPHWWYISQSS